MLHNDEVPASFFLPRVQRCIIRQHGRFMQELMYNSKQRSLVACRPFYRNFVASHSLGQFHAPPVRIRAQACYEAWAGTAWQRSTRWRGVWGPGGRGVAAKGLAAISFLGGTLE